MEVNVDHRKLRILLVDDESGIRGYLLVILESLGCEVVGEAGNGVEAVEQYEALLPDAVLMDLMMPEMDGLIASALIIKKFPEAQITMLTSISDARDVTNGFQLGISGYLRKGMADFEKHLGQMVKDWQKDLL
jgi:DNA-binding NarL/FixJ family response regulator